MKKIIIIIVVVIMLVSAYMTRDKTTTVSTNSVNTASTYTNENTSGPTNPDESASPNAENIYPQKIHFENYSGPECWYLDEPTIVVNETLYNICVDIDISKDDWHDQVKEIITLLWHEHSDAGRVMFKIFNDDEYFYQTQPLYNDLIAIYENEPSSYISESIPRIIWYPSGGGMYAEQETENWQPANE